MCGRWTVVIVLLASVYLYAGIVSYEGNSFPDESGWDVGQNWCDPTQWVEYGKFIQHVELCEGYDPPGGQQSSFVRSLEPFLGEEAFFIEWRVKTDAHRAELPWGGGAMLVAGSRGPVNYGFSIAGDQAQLNRDNQLPIISVDIDRAVPHTHRLELYADVLYVWYIDGEVVDAGTPEGAFPSYVPMIGFRTKTAFLANTTRWDYIRYGTLPCNGSGDFDSDENIELRDFYFFQECVSNSGPDDDAGPGCRFADFDDDTDVDLRDIALFQNAFTGGE